VDHRVAERIISNIEPGLRPVSLDGEGFVAFEWIGSRNYLGESGARMRGANVTSLDALMCGEANGRRVLVAIEWKYLERYAGKPTAVSTRGTDRVATYQALLDHPDCPIRVADHRYLFYEPYNQLMRQTLLAWQMATHGEFGASDWIHVHVIPEGNRTLRTSVRGAPDLIGRGLAEKWQSVLKMPQRYRVATPTEVVEGVDTDPRWDRWREWLTGVYLT
jgi:hypothetical protein